MGYDASVLSRGLVTCALLAGCTREPAEAICPEAGNGAIVVTEVRGDQDTTGPWVELYNTTNETYDLEGTRVRFRRRDGTDEVKVLIRRNLDIAAGGFAVIGLFPDEDRPAYVDYGFAGDYKETWRSSIVLDLEACETSLDRLIIDSLPDEGTYSLGVAPENAETNDLPENWCTDITGTPGVPNFRCPE